MLSTEDNQGILKSIILLVIVLIVGFALVNKDGIKDSVVRGSLKEKSLERVDTLDLKDMASIQIYDEQTVGWNANWLQFFRKNDKQKELVGKEIDGENGEVIIPGKENIYILNKANNNLKTLDLYGNEIDSKNFNEGLFNIKEEGDKLFLHFKVDNKEVLEINLEEGKFRKEFIDEKVLTYHSNEIMDKFIVSTLDIVNNLNSNIYVFNKENEKLWSTNLNDEIIVNTKLLRDKIIVLTDEKLYSIKEDGIEWEIEIDQLDDIFIREDEIYILKGDTLNIFDQAGELIETIELNKNYNKITNYGDYIILYGERNVLGITEGLKVFEYTHRENIIDIQANSLYLVIQIPGRADFYVLENK